MPSSQPPPTRRRFLHSAAALVGAGVVAGCGGTAESSSTASGAPNADPPDDAVTDPESVVLRAPLEEPVVREATDDADSGEESRIDEWTHNLVADDETVSIADVDGAAEARRFLEETDFETETVYVERHAVGECYEQRLCWIRWTDERVETSYARVLRPADAACSADVRLGVTHLIRIPVALDPESINRFSSSGGDRCRRLADSDGSEPEADGS